MHLNADTCRAQLRKYCVPDLRLNVYDEEMPRRVSEAFMSRQCNTSHSLEQFEIARGSCTARVDESVELFHLVHPECRLNIGKPVIVTKQLHFLMPCGVCFVFEFLRIFRQSVRAEHYELLVV